MEKFLKNSSAIVMTVLISTLLMVGGHELSASTMAFVEEVFLYSLFGAFVVAMLTVAHAIAKKLVS